MKSAPTLVATSFSFESTEVPSGRHVNASSCVRRETQCRAVRTRFGATSVAVQSDLSSRSPRLITASSASSEGEPPMIDDRCVPDFPGAGSSRCSPEALGASSLQAGASVASTVIPSRPNTCIMQFSSSFTSPNERKARTRLVATSPAGTTRGVRSRTGGARLSTTTAVERRNCWASRSARARSRSATRASIARPRRPSRWDRAQFAHIPDASGRAPSPLAQRRTKHEARSTK